MSKLIPRRTIDAIRQVVNVALDVAGIDCTLYIPTVTSYNVAETLDVYNTPDDYTYVSYSTTVFLDWKPSTYRLKKLGLFVEGNLPVLAWFPYKATALEGSLQGQEVDVDVNLKSYFRITPEFVPDNFEGVEEFEIVNVGVTGLHDATLTRVYSVAPRRVQQ
jgi:hypothetical protein